QLLLLKGAISTVVLLVGSLLILTIEIRARLQEKAKAEPPKEWDEKNGVWRDPSTNTCYCVKCKVTPLRVLDGRGWHCGACNVIHDSAEYLAKVAEQRRIENERVSAHNRGKTGWVRRGLTNWPDGR